MITEEIKTIQEWHHALNNSDKEKLSEQVNKDVKIGGPRGSVQGVEAMLEWVDRAKVSFKPQRYFQQNGVIVVEALGEWHNPESGEVIGSQMVSTAFTVEDTLIASIIRYDQLEEAFAATGLSAKNEVKV